MARRCRTPHTGQGARADRTARAGSGPWPARIGRDVSSGLTRHPTRRVARDPVACFLRTSSPADIDVRRGEQSIGIDPAARPKPSGFRGTPSIRRQDTVLESGDALRIGSFQRRGQHWVICQARLRLGVSRQTMHAWLAKYEVWRIEGSTSKATKIIVRHWTRAAHGGPCSHLGERGRCISRAASGEVGWHLPRCLSIPGSNVLDAHDPPPRS
jgi:hypothetical protein